MQLSIYGGARATEIRAVMTAATGDDFLVLSGISKRYGGVRALENVDFSCGRGKIHSVLGENGAGKSTLIEIIAGVVPPDAGELRLDGASAISATRRRPRRPALFASSRNCR